MLLHHHHHIVISINLPKKHIQKRQFISSQTMHNRLITILQKSLLKTVKGSTSLQIFYEILQLHQVSESIK